MSATFPKSEKLCGTQAIDHLYKNGKRLIVWPFRITYLVVDQAPTQVLVWAPKSLFKHAVDRNRLRRQMREAYRLNKHLLPSGSYYQIAFNYMDKELPAYRLIEKSMRKALHKIVQSSVEQ